ncbi:MAG: phosphatidylserine decarboxylase [Thermoplasmata archaeon]|nr:phosphatidylserine decarboxylase [Thermoplasmata archaeon]
MFAPGTARYLLPTLLLLIVVAAFVGVGELPRSLLLVVLLAIGFGYWAFFASFFRDPDREVGDGIVSAADGRVLEIVREEGRVRVAVFMGIADVHVNRFPLKARVEAIVSSGAGSRPAFSADARHNVQRSYLLATDLGPVQLIQMTGLVARRLVSLVEIGEERAKGDRLGMIVLGSRVDIVLPANRVKIAVSVGDRVRAGETTIARDRD